MVLHVQSHDFIAAYFQVRTWQTAHKQVCVFVWKRHFTLCWFTSIPVSFMLAFSVCLCVFINRKSLDWLKRHNVWPPLTQEATWWQEAVKPAVFQRACPYMLIKISGKVQTAVLCLLWTQPTMTRSAPIMMQSNRTTLIVSTTKQRM